MFVRFRPSELQENASERESEVRVSNRSLFVLTVSKQSKEVNKLDESAAKAAGTRSGATLLIQAR